ncbi:MAG: hypothetical protein EOQ92_28705 [Mesorhizobium sp.]|nr:MAG: hypothetical protein EOQ92_28705 [Mesorhizobium sp.]
MTDKLISTKADFPNVQVFMRVENARPVMSVVFDNKEFRTWQNTVLALVAIATFVGSIPAALWAGIAASRMGIPWGYAVAAVGITGVTSFLMVGKGWTVPYVIELDMARDRLRVLRRGRPKTERELSRLANLTVEEHPDTAYARNKRQQQGSQKISDPEKQHCLFGWFGARGAEQVLLVSRAEWPTRHSLMEVQQAIIWAKGMGEALVQEAARAGSEAAGHALAGAPPAGERGLKPPLD